MWNRVTHIVVQWLAQSTHIKGSLACSPCVRGFSPSAPAPSWSSETCWWGQLGTLNLAVGVSANGWSLYVALQQTGDFVLPDAVRVNCFVLTLRRALLNPTLTFLDRHKGYSTNEPGDFHCHEGAKCQKYSWNLHCDWLTDWLAVALLAYFFKHEAAAFGLGVWVPCPFCVFTLKLL